MEKTSLPLAFDRNGTKYKGWATASDKTHPDGFAASYHVVLNEVFFGNVSRDNGQWLVDEQRPHELVAAVGECLDRIAKPGTATGAGL